MKKLSKDKLNQLVLVALVTAAVLAGLWFSLIHAQYETLHSLAAKKMDGEKKLAERQAAIRNTDRVKAQLTDATRELGEAEHNMASGDPFSWIINTIKEFKAPYTKIDIPQFSTIVTGDMSLLPRFPYKQLTITISGTAYYHDLGRFIADFEDHFTEMRIEDLEIQRLTGVSSDSEKLFFKMNIVALIKSTAT